MFWKKIFRDKYHNVIQSEKVLKNLHSFVVQQLDAKLLRLKNCL